MTVSIKIKQKEDEDVLCELSDSSELWFKDKTGVSEEIIGEKVDASLLAIVHSVSWEASSQTIDTEEGIRKNKEYDNRYVHEVVGKVANYNPENNIDSRWPLVEIDTGQGKIFIEHHNVGGSPSKDQYWKDRKTKILAEELQIHSIE